MDYSLLMIIAYNEMNFDEEENRDKVRNSGSGNVFYTKGETFQITLGIIDYL